MSVSNQLLDRDSSANAYLLKFEKEGLIKVADCTQPRPDNTFAIAKADTNKYIFVVEATSRPLLINEAAQCTAMCISQALQVMETETVSRNQKFQDTEHFNWTPICRDHHVQPYNELGGFVSIHTTVLEMETTFCDATMHEVAYDFASQILILCLRFRGEAKTHIQWNLYKKELNIVE